MDNKDIARFCDRIRFDLNHNILPFWIKHARDTENGGFYGRIENDLSVQTEAAKGLVQTMRLLWTYSVVQHKDPKDEYMEMAKRAYDFFINNLYDEVYGGAYWLLDYKGDVLDDKKKIYGQAFSIYSLAEYYRLTNYPEVLDRAKEIFKLIEDNNYDNEFKGYFETSDRNWSLSTDFRLSDSDMNEKKSMNTHLHLMEAYSTLYQVWPDPFLADKIRDLINIFLNHIIDPQNYHFKLFFNESWISKSKNISFGHDIEGSWLLCEAADVLADQELRNKVKNMAINIVDATIRDGLSPRNSIIQEQDSDGRLDYSLQWWQQAEAVVGFINAFQLNRDESYLQHALTCWQFIDDYIIDKEKGEWFYEISAEGNPNLNQFKGSEWKGPYHNARACLEVLRRLGC